MQRLPRRHNPNALSHSATASSMVVWKRPTRMPASSSVAKITANDLPATHSLKLVHDRLVRQRPNRPPRNKLENRRRDYLEEPTICGGLPKQREIRGQPSLELRDCGGRQRRAADQLALIAIGVAAVD